MNDLSESRTISFVSAVTSFSWPSSVEIKAPCSLLNAVCQSFSTVDTAYYFTRLMDTDFKSKACFLKSSTTSKVVWMEPIALFLIVQPNSGTPVMTPRARKTSTGLTWIACAVWRQLLRRTLTGLYLKSNNGQSWLLYNQYICVSSFKPAHLAISRNQSPIANQTNYPNCSTSSAQRAGQRVILP